MSDHNNFDIVEFIGKYKSLTKEDIEIIRASNIIKPYTKGSFLLKADQIAKECFLLLKGCVRSYYLIGGDDKTTELFTENEAITPVSYYDGKPSEYFIECLEDCVLSTSSEERTQEFLAKFPQYAPLFIQIGNDIMAKKHQSFDEFRNLPPDKRYLKLVELRPDLVQRVPQYHIASYLGIKPQSLSRIRKRLADG